MAPDIEQIAETYYTDELPYHNFEHVKDGLNAAEQLLDRCDEYEVDIDEEVVRTALYFHDAGYQKDHESRGFDTKEDLSKNIARDELEKHGYDKEFIENVNDCIEATKHAATPQNK